MTSEQNAMLQGTIDHYNLNNRSVVYYECTYLPAHKNTVGCAIGRLIDDKELCKKLDSININGIGDGNIFKQLPLELQSLGKKFLSKVQMLHDMSNNWDKDGLTEEGLVVVAKIKNDFK